MTDETNPAVENQGQINPGETPAQIPTEQAQPTGEAQEQPAGQTPQYVTKEEMEGFAADILRRAKQSDRDRSKRIEDQLTGIKAMLEKAGTKLDAEQEANLRDQITDEIDNAEGQQPAEPREVQQPAGPSPVDQFLAGIWAEAGATVTPNDPEWAALKKVMDDNFDNPQGLTKVLLAANKAAQDKQKRTADMQETAAARVGGGDGTKAGTVPESGSARDMLADAYKKG